MNREKMSKLPEMQISFIDTICAPIYSAFAKLFPHKLNPLLDGCLKNRNLWADLRQKTQNSTADNDKDGTGESLNITVDCYLNNNLSDMTPTNPSTATQKDSKTLVSKSEIHLNQLLDEAIDDRLDQQVETLSDSNARSPELLFSAINLEMFRPSDKAESCQRKSV